MARITRPLTNNEILKAKPREKETMVSLNDILTFTCEKRLRLQTQGTNTEQKFFGCIAGGIPDVSDKKALSQSTLSAWQEPPVVPHRLQYCQAKHQLAD